MSTSAFFTPTYGIGATNVYVRSEDSGNPAVGERISYKADNATVNAIGLPIFYFRQLPERWIRRERLPHHRSGR